MVVKFRFEISDDVLMAHSTPSFQRLDQYLDSDPADGSGYVWWTDPATRVKTVEGAMSSDRVAVLQALAMGHDFSALLPAEDA